MSETALDPAELAAALIRRPSVTPKDEGAIDLVAVDDLGRGPNKGPHCQHCAGLDDHPFDNFAACADKAIILDDHRLGLQRLEHPADPDAAREMAVLAALPPGADRRPRTAHRPRPP